VVHITFGRVMGYYWRKYYNTRHRATDLGINVASRRLQ